MARTGAKLMTKGPIGPQILAFALPLFLGNLFQQLYNTADSLIVGNMVNSDALAAVSSSGNLIFLMIGFFAGISVGAGVVIARYFGARRIERMERAIHTAIAFGLVAGVLLMVAGLVATPTILRLMGTPEDVLPASVVYFRVYFLGSPAFVLYNICQGIMQSVGDSKRPLYYLIVSSVTNVILDLTFISLFARGEGTALAIRGVACAAAATAVSQYLSAILSFTRLTKVDAEYKVTLKNIRFDREMLGEIIRNGLPTGLQNSIIAIANVVVQSNINEFGKLAMAGCGSYSKIEGFGFLPINCFSMALTTFISQNLGAREYDRAKKGAKFGIVCSVCTAEVIGIIINLLAPYLISAFNSDPGVVQYGVMQARTVTLFYCLLSCSHCLAAIFRGAGRSSVPMFVMLACWCVIRVSYITVIMSFTDNIRAVFWAYPITWSLSTIVFAIYYFKSDWLHAYEKQNLI